MEHVYIHVFRHFLTPQGKAYGQMLADLELSDLPSLEDMENDYKLNMYAELS